MERSFNVEFIDVTAEGEWDISVRWPDTSESSVSLRSTAQLTEMLSKFASADLFLDITGLSHHVWAPMLRAALLAGKHVWVVYVEPGEYTFSTAPTEGEIFDLSVRTRGIAPLPGFAVLRQFDASRTWLLPLLGFEGTRFGHILEKVQPDGKRVVPIIGVPGFRSEYPFHAYLGNKVPLLESRAWKAVRYSTANCPFELLYLLEEFADEHPDDFLAIAPIGTKPHGLGAVLFAIKHPERAEIIYDHPIRKPGRTAGTDRVLVYDVSAVME